MEKLLDKIIDFIDQDELKTMILHFNSLDAQFITKRTKLAKILNGSSTVKMYISKYSDRDYRDGVVFMIYDVGYGDFFTSVINDNVFRAKSTNTIKKFSDYTSHMLIVKEIRFSSTTLSITVNEIDSSESYMSHNFTGFSDYSYSKETLEEIRKSPTANKNCYIATLAYGDVNHPKVEMFRNYRDNHLRNTLVGVVFIKIYYLISPHIVKALKPFVFINFLNRKLLDLILKKVVAVKLSSINQRRCK